MKKAFTLLELMVVLSIIGILVGMVMTVAQSSLQWSREWKSDALCKVLQAGLAEYKAQKDKWPGSFGSKTNFSKPNSEGIDGNTDAEKYELDESEVKDMVKAVVVEAVENGNPVMDISQLYVSRSPGRPGDKIYGEDFMDAVRSTKDSPTRMKVAEMYFGYPEKKSGYFRSFRIIYSKGASDSLTVLKQKGDN